MKVKILAVYLQRKKISDLIYTCIFFSDINECNIANICAANEDCCNSFGSYNCVPYPATGARRLFLICLYTNLTYISLWLEISFIFSLTLRTFKRYLKNKIKKKAKTNKIKTIFLYFESNAGLRFYDVIENVICR